MGLEFEKDKSELKTKIEKPQACEGMGQSMEIQEVRAEDNAPGGRKGDKE